MKNSEVGESPKLGGPEVGKVLRRGRSRGGGRSRCGEVLRRGRSQREGGGLNKLISQNMNPHELKKLNVPQKMLKVLKFDKANGLLANLNQAKGLKF